MINLNDRHAINQLDQSHVLESIERLPEQIQDAWDQTTTQNYHQLGRGVDHIIVAGMGGSNLGAEVIKALAKSHLKVPLEIVKDYHLPAYVNDKTLVILSSYSGTTEETLTAAVEAEAKHARIAIITAGGDLAALAQAKKYPAYIINPQHNPSNQPRMAIGYAIAGQIGLLNSFGLIDASTYNIARTIDFLRHQNSTLNPESGDNLAKQLARSAENKIIYLISAGHLTGATHVFNNQLNENAKHLTVELQLPELNHHYMEALPHPTDAKNHTLFWFIESPLYELKHSLRLHLTQDVVTQNKYTSQIITLTANDPFTQVFELIQLGAYTNFYLAMLHNINPAPIPWVDYFKQKLKLHNQ